MDISVTSLVTFVVAAVGVFTGISGWVVRGKKESSGIASEMTLLRSDIGHIRSGVDDIKSDMKDQKRDVRDLSERLTRVEEMSKSAHRRLDTLEGVNH